MPPPISFSLRQLHESPIIYPLTHPPIINPYSSPIRVVELFAGVGGFRIAFENTKKSAFQTVFANQWEPGQKAQWAYHCYEAHFGPDSKCVNEDINLIFDLIPSHDLLKAGFPCQDYSVANHTAQGIEGKKGVLWWPILKIVKKHHPKFLLLENVDHLVLSPKGQPGRDFGIILKCLDSEGYAVEWRIIKASEYGEVQNRRRIFIFAFRRTTQFYQDYITYSEDHSPSEWLHQTGFFAKPFPVAEKDEKTKKTGAVDLNEYKDLVDVTNRFQARFWNSGVMCCGKVYTEQLTPAPPPGTVFKTLGDIVEQYGVDNEFFIDPEDIEAWKKAKGSKKLPNGKSEGTCPFPDPLDRPARTIITSEGTRNRTSHVIADPATGKLRFLTPKECERINGFPDGWTEGMPNRQRYFTMGNALVVPVVEKMAQRILEIFYDGPQGPKSKATSEVSPMEEPMIPDFITFDDDGGATINVPAFAQQVERDLELIQVKSAISGLQLYGLSNGRYVPYSTEWLLGYMKEIIGAISPHLIKMGQLKETIQLIQASTSYISLTALNSDEDSISFQNGSLLLNTTPEPTLVYPHLDMYGTIQMPFDWPGSDISTPVFDWYIKFLTNGDPVAELLLLQWVGLCLSNIPGQRVRRALFMVGPGDAGAELRRFVERLLGSENCVGMDLSELETKAGVKALYGKRLAGCGSMGTNTLKGLKMFQRVMGGDSLDTGKGQSFVYRGLLWFCGSQAPALKAKPDRKTAEQMVILHCGDVPACGLSDDLYQERAGIVFKAVMALRGIISRGFRLAEPESVLQARERLLGSTDSVIRFFNDCMCPRADGRITSGDPTSGDVFGVYKTWCEDKGDSSVPKLPQFKEQLAVHLGCPMDELVKRQKGNSFFSDFDLTPETKERYSEALSRK